MPKTYTRPLRRWETIMTKKTAVKNEVVVQDNEPQAKMSLIGRAEKRTEEATPENLKVLELSAKVQDLEAKLKEATKPRDIEAAILYFEEKKRKINQLAAFEQVGQNLFEAKTEVENVNDPNDINVKLFKLSLTRHNEYREGDKLLSVTNNPVILKAIDFLMQEVAKKVESLKADIRG